MSKVQVQEQSQIVLVAAPNIISTPYGNDEILIDTSTGNRCIIPKFPTQIRARCGGTQGNFAEVTQDRTLDRGNVAEVAIVDYRVVRLTLDKKNYVSHEFIEVWCLPTSGDLRKIYLGKEKGDMEYANHTTRLTTFLVSAETAAKDDKPKSQSKNYESFFKTVNAASLANQALLNELTPEEMMSLGNLSDWLKNKGPNSIFNKIVEVSFLPEKSGDFPYFSMKFTTKSPVTALENQALLFAQKIREDAEKHGHIRCMSERFLAQETYINALNGGESPFSDTAQIEGEIVDETKLLIPAF